MFGGSHQQLDVVKQASKKLKIREPHSVKRSMKLEDFRKLLEVKVAYHLRRGAMSCAPTKQPNRGSHLECHPTIKPPKFWNSRRLRKTYRKEWKESATHSSQRSRKSRRSHSASGRAEARETLNTTSTNTLNMRQHERSPQIHLSITLLGLGLYTLFNCSQPTSSYKHHTTRRSPTFLPLS